MSGGKEGNMASKKPKRRSLKYVHWDARGRMFVRIPFKKGDKWTAKEVRVDSEDEALVVIQRIKAELGSVGPTAFDGDRMTVRDLVDRYLVAYPNKPGWYTQPIVDFFGDRKIRSLTYGDCKQFKVARLQVPNSKTGKPRTQATVNRELEILRAVLRYGHGHGWLRLNPFNAGPPLISKAAESSRDRIPTPDEEDRLIAACVGRRRHLKLIIIATLDTGLRKSALQAIRWRDIDWFNRLIRVPKATSVNKDRPPLCGISLRLFYALREAYGDRQPPDGFICGKATGEFKKAYAAVCEAAGIEGLRFNDLRHGYATKLMLAGVPLELAMKASGHSNPDIHARYTNVDQAIADQVRDAIDQFHAQRAENPPTISRAIN